MRFYLLLFIVFLTLGKEIWAQEPNYEHYSTENGLPSAFIFQMYQDRAHNIWFATNAGISRYNGESFRNYGRNDGLLENGILDIYDAPDGTLYFLTTSNSVYRYNPIEDRMQYFRYFKENGKPLGIIYEKRCSFLVTGDGSFRMGFTIGQGFAKIDKNGTVHFQKDTLQKGIQIKSFGDQKLLYSNTNDNYLNVDGKIIDYNNPHGIHLNAVFMEDDITVLGNQNQLSIIKEGQIILNKIFDQLVIAIDLDQQNNIWVSFYQGGTKCYELDNNQLIEKKHLLKDYSITTVLEDHEGGFWISTIENGIFYTPNINIQFFNAESGLSGSRIIAFEGNKNGEVITGYQNGSITIFRSDTIYRTFDISAQYDLNTSRITDIAYDKVNQIYWVSHNSTPLILKDDELKSAGYNTLSTVQILPEKNGNGFWYRSPTKFGYMGRDSLVYEVEHKTTNPIMFDFKGKVQMTSSSHNIKYDCEGQVSATKRDKVELISAFQNLNDSLIINYFSDRLKIFRPKDTLVFINQGQQKKYTYAGWESSDAFWVTSNKGLNKLTIDGDSVRSQSYLREIGILHNDQQTIFENQGDLWISTNAGLYIIDKNDINSPTPSAPTIRSISSHDTVYNNPADGIIFQPNEDNLSFQLQAITFKYKDEYSFEYQIDQINNTFWPLTGSELNLTNLGPGDYALKIRIKTTNGIYSPVTSYSFKILTPFWLTWWFFSIIILAFALLVYLIMKRIIRRIRIQERKKSELNELIHSLRLQSIQSQFNPHFTFNAISSIQRHISPNTIDDAKEYLGMFSSIMRAILLNSEKETILVSQELKLLDTYLKLEQLRFGEKLRYEFILDESVDPDYDRLPPMIIQPILENAINYGIFNKPEGGNISIRFAVKNEVLHCEIEDNGIGREAAAVIQTKKKMKGSGKGLKLVRERLMVANTTIKDFFEITDLFDTEGSPMGTKVVLKIELND